MTSGRVPVGDRSTRNALQDADRAGWRHGDRQDQARGARVEHRGSGVPRDVRRGRAAAGESDRSATECSDEAAWIATLGLDRAPARPAAHTPAVSHRPAAGAVVAVGARLRAVPAVLVSVPAAAWYGKPALQLRQVATGALPGEDWIAPFVTAMFATLIASVVAAFASPVVRYRHGGRQQRQQLKWILLAVDVLAVEGNLGELPAGPGGRQGCGGRGDVRGSGIAVDRAHGAIPADSSGTGRRPDPPRTSVTRRIRPSSRRRASSPSRRPPSPCDMPGHERPPVRHRRRPARLSDRSSRPTARLTPGRIRWWRDRASDGSARRRSGHRARMCATGP